MKHIVKGDEPTSFGNWKQQNPGANWTDFSGSDVYLELRHGLIGEQGSLCCYCEVALKGNGNAHIEHFKPKSGYPRETFKVQNLLACCLHTDSCGHKKNSDYFDELISPLAGGCESCFTYTGNGKIIPSDENDTFSEKTIELLGLNCRRLRDRRRSIISALDYEGTTIEYLKQSLENCNAWYHGFFTVIRYVAGKQGSAI